MSGLGTYREHFLQLRSPNGHSSQQNESILFLSKRETEKTLPKPLADFRNWRIRIIVSLPKSLTGESLLTSNRQLETNYPSLRGHTLTITQPSNANAKFKINIQSESVVATKLEGLNVQTGAKTGINLAIRLKRWLWPF